MLTIKQLDTLKENIIEYLTAKGIYDITDETLIDQLISNIKMKQDAEKHIKKFGIVLNVRKTNEQPYFQQNPSVAIKGQCEKMISQLSTKLSLTPVERTKSKTSKVEGDELNLNDLLDE
jgi:P27 family predicted phage terminase small subunit